MPWDSVIEHGPTGLLVLFVLLVFLGRLLPRSWVRDRVRDKEDELQRERARNDELMAGLKDLLTYAEAADRILRAWYRRHESAEILRAVDRERGDS